MCIRSVAVPQDIKMCRIGKSMAHQQHDDHPHEDLLQVPQILHTLQQGCCAAEECVLACLLHCMQTNGVKPFYMSQKAGIQMCRSTIQGGTAQLDMASAIVHM